MTTPETHDGQDEVQELINKFKRISSDVLSRQSDQIVTTRFRQYYTSLVRINDYAEKKGNAWYLGPVLLGDAKSDWIVTLSRIALRILLTPNSVPNTVTVETLDLLREFSPLYADELTKIVASIDFNPPILTEVTWKKKPFHGQAPVYDTISINTVSFAACLELEHEFPGFRYPYTTAFLTNTKYSVRNTHEVGNNEKARQVTRNKFYTRSSTLDPSLHKLLIAATNFVAKKFFLDDIEVVMDLSESNLKRLLDKRTSAGFIFDHLYELTTDGIVKTPKATKKNATTAVIRKFYAYIQELTDFYFGRTTKMPTLPSPAIEVEKNELLNQLFHSLLMALNEPTPDKFIKIVNKTRLFYTSGAVAYLFDKLIGEWFNNVMRYYMSAIGIKVEGGGILHLFDMLNGGSSNPLSETWAELTHRAQEVYGVDLNAVQFGEGDCSKFDFSLLFEVLSHVGGLVTMCHVCPDGMPQEVFEHLMTEFIQRMGVKLLYMRGINKWFYAKGTMNSGEFMTSIGNTVYHMLMFIMYIMSLREANLDNPLMLEIIDSGMLFFAFYSDDHVGRWPKWCNGYTIYKESDTVFHDYITFCINNLNMTYKWESLKIYDYLYGMRIYETTSSNVVVETAHRPALSFLRYSVHHVFLDGEYKGMRVWRDTEDLISKMMLSMTATKDPETHMFLIASLARLSSGNYEAYYQLRTAYYKLLTITGEPTKEKWDAWYDQPGRAVPFSIRTVLEEGRIYCFPEIDDINEIQQQGFMNRSGFKALNADGARIDGDIYYMNDISYVNKNLFFEDDCSDDELIIH